jgi:hypothetical protein
MAQHLNDKDWLEKVKVAYNAYKSQVGPNLPIENFISWLYGQYGIVEPKDKK